MDIETVRDSFKKYTELVKNKGLQFDTITTEKLSINDIICKLEKLHYNYLLFAQEFSTSTEYVHIIYIQLIKIIEPHKKNNKGYFY